MDFWDRVKNAMDKGLEGSRDILTRVKERTQDLGERGVLRIEIAQLENQAEKLLGQLGARTYEALVEESAPSVSTSTRELSEVFDEIDVVRKQIAEKEAALELAKRKDSASEG
jgi:tRNA(Ile)-lysidine synthase TilS/MesJ